MATQHGVAPEPTGESQRFDWHGVLRLGIVVALVVAVGVLGSWWAVLVIGALLMMIFLHELGHFLTARRAGMKVSEFFLGFGPRIWSFRRGEVEYGLKAIPAGAYVRILGMNNLEEVDPAEEHRTYRSKGYWSRLSVATAGSAMHFLLAFVLLFTALVFFGRQTADNWVVNRLTVDSPAVAAGVQVGDRVVAVDGVPVEEFDDLTEAVRARPGETVPLVIQRDGETLELTVVLADRNPAGEPVGFLGVGPDYPYAKKPLLTAVRDTFTGYGEVAWQSVAGLGRVFSPGGLQDYVDNLSGRPSDEGVSDSRLVSPVGAVQIGAQFASNGMADLLIFLAAINIFIGIFNLVPLLPFDGGHVAIATYEAIRSRHGRRYHADVTKLLPLTYAVVVVLLLLFLGNLYLDISDPITP